MQSSPTNRSRPVKLTAELIESFSGIFLSHHYDQPQPTPDFHREVWAEYCSDHPRIACAAPRNHAKSTGLTFDYALANLCFRVEDYIILVGSSEEMAIEHLVNISTELHENEDLRREFGIKEFITDAKSDIIILCDDGHQFRIVARGAEQKIRGRLWLGKRPGLLLCDDMEDDEQVENRDRRRKFSRWFFRAAKQALRDGGRVRVHGTILHEDSLLSNLIRHPGWKGLCYRAHKSFDDFSEILWPEKFSEARLRDIRQEMIDSGDGPGYSQEYLNDPLDHSDAYLKRDDFIEMKQEDHDVEKVFYASADLAVSKQDAANRTSITVGGKCPRNIVHFVDQRVNRWDSKEWIDEMFTVYKAWPNLRAFFVEDGVIWKSVWPMIQNEMQRRDVWIPFVPVPSIKDKGVRGRPLQRLMRARGTRWDKRAEWYPGMEAEMLKFTGTAQSTLDDQFDSAAQLVKGIEIYQGNAEKDDFKTEEEEAFEQEGFWNRQQRQDNPLRNSTTGY